MVQNLEYSISNFKLYLQQLVLILQIIINNNINQTLELIIQVEYIAYQALVLAIRETMSWWDTSQLTSFATNALKNAQKKIDKVLDIPTEDDDSTSNSNRFSSKFKFSITFKASICYLFNSSVSNSLAVRESLCEKAVLLVEGKMIALNFVLSHNRFRFTCDTSIPYFSLF